jgi:hypothetical protein
MPRRFSNELHFSGFGATDRVSYTSALHGMHRAGVKSCAAAAFFRSAERHSGAAHFHVD